MTSQEALAKLRPLLALAQQATRGNHRAVALSPGDAEALAVAVTHLEQAAAFGDEMRRHGERIAELENMLAKGDRQ